jgi:hypothetical protein
MFSRRHFLLTAAALRAAGQEMKSPSSGEIPEIPAAPPQPASAIPAPYKGSEWKIAYFHDESASALTFSGFICPDPGFVMACGVLAGRRGGRPQNIGIVSRDGGLNWSDLKLPGVPTAIHALDAGHIWLVSGNRLYFSGDSGTRWNRLRLPRKTARVCFVTPERGFAYGDGKVFHRTSDGGRRWTPVPESQALSLNDDTTVFRDMVFWQGRVGVLAGNSRRPLIPSEEVPAWIAPERAISRRPIPATTAMMLTQDGGETWRSSVTSAFGDVFSVRLTGSRSIALFDYGEGFIFPTEVFLNSSATGKTEPLFRRKALRVTDLLLEGDSGYMLSLIEPFGRLPAAGIPGRLRIVYSPDGKQWFQMPVDYRAQGADALLASAGGRHFAALSNGMILRLAS